MKKIYLFLLLSFIVGVACGDEKLESLFKRDKKAVRNFNFYRAYLNQKTGVINIPPAGVFLSKKVCGSGVYTVTFAVDESDKKFRYHQQYFVFYFTPPAKTGTELQTKMKKDAEYLYLVWRKSGQVEFYKHSSLGEKEKLGIWIKPGPDKDNAYVKDTFVTMNVLVSENGKDLKIYFNKKPEGEADCEFQMPESPAKGQFGFYNPKWYSTILVRNISYQKR